MGPPAMPIGAGFTRLEEKAGDRIEFLVVDSSLARAFFHGIPAARLLARATRTGSETAEAHVRTLLRPNTPAYEAVCRAVARHARVAQDEGSLQASESAIAVLVWAVASAPDADASLSEIAPPAGEASACDPEVLRSCARHDDRLASRAADKRAPAFEACVRLAAFGSLRPRPAQRVRRIAAQLEHSEMGVRLFGDPPSSIFPRRVDDEITPSDRRMAAVNRVALDALVAMDPRELGSAIGRMDQAEPGAGAEMATFVADLARLLADDGTVVAALCRPDPPELDDAPPSEMPGSMASWIPAEWTPATALAMAQALETGKTTPARARTAITRGGDAALDAVGAEMLDVTSHTMASAAFAEILSHSDRPRDVLRLVTYFAIAPDPVRAARALSGCKAAELPRVLGAWLDGMLPTDGEDGPESSAARVTACIASLKPYPSLYGAVRPLLTRLDVATPE
jgi:hypothetical protein